MKHILAMVFLFLGTMAFAGGLVGPPLDDPYVNVPPTDMSGIYIGVSISGTQGTEVGVDEWSETTQEEWEEPIMDKCPKDGGHSGGIKCTFPDNIDVTEIFPGIERCRGYSQTCRMNGNRVFIKGAEGDFYVYNTGETETVYGPEIVTFFEEAWKLVSEEATIGGHIGFREYVGPGLVGFEVGSNGTIHTAEIQVGLQLDNVFAYGLAGVASYNDQDGTILGAGADWYFAYNKSLGAKYTVGDFGSIETDTLGIRASYHY